MNRIIKEKQQPKAEFFATVKLLSAIRTGSSTFWKKYKMFVGYGISCILAVIYLTIWPFDGVFFTISVVWALSFQRLRYAYVSITKKGVVTMWTIFCFGLSGILMQVLKVEEHYAVSAIAAGIIVTIFYSYISIISYYLKYNDKLYGWDCDRKTKYNGILLSLLIYSATLALAEFVDNQTKEKKEQQFLQQQFNKEMFVPVKIIETESFKGTTYYVLEAKGEKFFVSPFKYPEVRNIKENSEVKVILGDVDSEYRLKGVKKIQFKN